MRRKDIMNVAKKISAIFLSFILLFTGNAGLFAQSINGKSLDEQKLEYAPQAATNMINLRLAIEDEISKNTEEELLAKENDAKKILLAERQPMLDKMQNNPAKKLEDQVKDTLKLLSPLTNETKIIKGYPDSTYFKKPGSLNEYLYKRAVILSTTNRDGNFLGPLSAYEIGYHAEDELRNVFINASNNEQAKKTENEQHGNAMENLFILLAYYNSFGENHRDEVAQSLDFAKDWCQNLKEDEKKYNACIEEQLRDNEYYQAFKGLYNYDDSVMNERRKEIKKYISIAGEKAGLCINKVLMPLQAEDYDLAFRDIKSYLDSKASNLPWGFCGISEQEGKNLILNGVMSLSEANRKAEEVKHPTNFWKRTSLDDWKYVSPSYYANRAEARTILTEKYPQDVEGLTSREIEIAGLRSGFLELSLNENITKIAAGYMLYGLIMHHSGIEKLQDQFEEYLYQAAMGINGNPYTKMSKSSISTLARTVLHTNAGFTYYTDPKYKQGQNLFNFEEELRRQKNLEVHEAFYSVLTDLIITVVLFDILSEFIIGPAFIKIGNLVGQARASQSLVAGGNAITKLRPSASMGEILGIPGFCRNNIMNYRLLSFAAEGSQAAPIIGTVTNWEAKAATTIQSSGMTMANLATKAATSARAGELVNLGTKATSSIRAAELMSKATDINAKAASSFRGAELALYEAKAAPSIAGGLEEALSINANLTANILGPIQSVTASQNSILTAVAMAGVTNNALNKVRGKLLQSNDDKKDIQLQIEIKKDIQSQTEIKETLR